MDILDIFGHFYLNHLSPLWGYFSHFYIDFNQLMENKQFCAELILHMITRFCLGKCEKYWSKNWKYFILKISLITTCPRTQDDLVW